MMKYFSFTFVFVALFLCSCRNNQAGMMQSSDAQTEDAQIEDTLRSITADMAYEGINNYCHKEYDWSVAKDYPEMMYVQMGEETETEYLVIFRSYTGALVHFYVNKTTGTTRIVEKVPSLNVEQDAGTINLLDYLEKK